MSKWIVKLQNQATPSTSNENGKFGEKSSFLYMWSFMEEELFMKARVQKVSQLLVWLLIFDPKF